MSNSLLHLIIIYGLSYLVGIMVQITENNEVVNSRYDFKTNVSLLYPIKLLLYVCLDVFVFLRSLFRRILCLDNKVYSSFIRLNSVDEILGYIVAMSAYIFIVPAVFCLSYIIICVTNANDTSYFMNCIFLIGNFFIFGTFGHLYRLFHIKLITHQKDCTGSLGKTVYYSPDPLTINEILKVLGIFNNKKG